MELKNVNGSTVLNYEDGELKTALSDAIRKGISLANADLKGADLSMVNLYGANLKRANLEGASLYGANLSRAKLQCANLEGANLYGTDLLDTNLIFANLKGANLANANLKGANLEGADLKGANLDWANLNGAKLYIAGLIGAQNIPYIPLSCPSDGAFTAWKKVNNEYLVKLQIPEDARRSSATTRKCRCDKAMVLDITSLDGEEHYDEVVNYNYTTTVYKVGEMVYPDSFDKNRWNECSNGIHFFINKEDAINYRT